ncbi:Flp family type IVb pilin [Pirellulaceae bacterium SH449]
MTPRRQKHHAERGASWVEYGILVALVSMVCIVAIQSLGQAIDDQFANAEMLIAGAGTMD